MEKPKCQDCFWYVNAPDEVSYSDQSGAVVVVKLKEKPYYGFCHLRPPISGKNPWPQVLPQDYCARFQHKDEETE